MQLYLSSYKLGNKQEILKNWIKEHGNKIILQAMKYSGFDRYLKEISADGRYLYAGYSAGICVLAPRLEGMNLVDEPLNPYNLEEVTYEGIGLIDYVPAQRSKR